MTEIREEPHFSAYFKNIPSSALALFQKCALCTRRIELTLHKNGHYPVHMNAITYTAARENIASTMNQVCLDRDPVIITRKRDQSVVMIALEDYEALEETAYLLRSPANAKRLIASIEAAEQGNVIEKEIIIGE